MLGNGHPLGIGPKSSSKSLWLGSLVRKEWEQMSTFPTKILLATDGSEDAQLAATTAVDVANSTDSELHVVHARFALPWTTGYSSATEPPTTSIASQEEARQIVLR